MAPTTKAPMRVLLADLLMSGILGGGGAGVGFAAVQETDDVGVRLIAAKDMGIAARDHGVGRRIKEYAVVADGKDAVEIVGDDHDGHAHVLLEFEDELVQQGGADRVSPAEGSSKKTISGSIASARAQPGAFAHTAADFGRVIILESGKADEREFEGGLFPDLGGGKLRIALQGQGHILGEGHGAPQRAALEEQAHAAEKFWRSLSVPAQKSCPL